VWAICFDAPRIGVKSSEPVLAAVPDQRAFHDAE
jgi:hypothetical protein